MNTPPEIGSDLSRLYWSSRSAIWLSVDPDDTLSLYPEDSKLFRTSSGDSLTIADLPAAVQSSIIRVRNSNKAESIDWIDGAMHVAGTVSFVVGKVFCEFQTRDISFDTDWQKFDDLPMGVIATTDKFVTQYANRALADLLGYNSASELIGKRPKDFVHPDDKEFTVKAHEEFLSGKSGTHEYVFRRQVSSGQIKWLKVSLATVKDSTPYHYLGVVMPVEEEQSVATRLKKSESRLRSIFYNAQGGLVLCNSDLRIVASNSAFCEMLEYAEESEIRGEYMPLITLEEDRLAEKELFDHLIATKGSHYRIEKRYLTRSGEAIWCDVIVSAVWDGKDKPSNFISIIQNIQNAKESEARMKSLSDLKDKFLSVLSHDLKNPINAVMGLIELTKESLKRNDAAEAKELVELMELSMHNMHDLLLNMLDWSRTHQGVMPFEPVQVDLKSFADSISQIVKIGIHQKGLQLKVSVNEGDFVWADSHMLKSIILNLLTNAIKFTSRGGEIRLSFKSDGDKVLVEVSDDGVGMSQNQIDELFQASTYLQSDGTENESGTGLGLFLVKDFVDYHQSTLQVKSQEGKGSSFSFYLPMKAPQ
ncbi:PAS domain-containing sensor histidine kinase [Phaeocystidibacter luteus]|uniref:histidine kinase n=1 Tax=Phaeocystidibacter luteus TaxID=911197 RepID=A0A6N6RIY9_9FLAO|nr:PAS domain-containing sensor histidine kinase [Phaeocystidibacter luteus]KAB2814356.1 PAS domain-containing sensor histidine kinase [Phaeocystidibacter luteus]